MIHKSGMLPSLGEWKEIVETCAAFASARGGTTYVGVSPVGEVTGVGVGKGTLEDIVNKITSNTSPRLVPSVSTTIQNGMTVNDLWKDHDSKPRNPLIANAFFLIKYVEQFGTGTRRIISDCQSLGIPEPEFRVRSGTFIAIFRPADTVRSEPIAHAEISSRPRSESRADSGAELILSALRQQPLSAEDLSQKMGRKTVSGAFKRSVRDLLKREFIERTIPDKPNSRLQKHRLTAKGLALAGNGKK